MHRNSDNPFFRGIQAFLCSMLMMTPLFAGTPLWTFEPLTATTVAVPANAGAIVQYRVTNQSTRTHTLAVQQVVGVMQLITGLNACNNPFVLTGKG